MLQSVINSFWTKNFALLILGLIAWIIFVPGFPELRLLNFIVILEILTLFLCQLAVYVHYKSPVTHNINTGKDGELSFEEQKVLISANSRIYQGVHLFVAIVVLAVYFLEKAA
jgi:hypothetical protein